MSALSLPEITIVLTLRVAAERTLHATLHVQFRSRYTT